MNMDIVYYSNLAKQQKKITRLRKNFWQNLYSSGYPGHCYKSMQSSFMKISSVVCSLMWNIQIFKTAKNAYLLASPYHHKFVIAPSWNVWVQWVFPINRSWVPLVKRTGTRLEWSLYASDIPIETELASYCLLVQERIFSSSFRVAIHARRFEGSCVLWWLWRLFLVYPKSNPV